MAFDAIDRKILETVQEDCRISAEWLGDRVGLSASAAQRRWNRLRSEGVIEREVAVVPPSRVGRSLLVLVEVTLEGDDVQAVQAFRRQVRDHPNVMQCFYVTGDCDYVLLYCARSMEEYEAFTHEAFFDNPYVVTFKTKVVMNAVKMSLAVPVGA